MTLVLAAANLSYTTVVADRRLTARMKPVDEEFPKATLLSVPDGRVAVAFSGLATAPGFRMNFWLPDALLEVARGGTGLDRIVEGVCERLNRAFAHLPASVPQEAKPTALLFAGYTYDEGGSPRLFRRGVYNHRGNSPPVTEFAVEPVAERERFNHVSALGQWQLIDEAKIYALGDLINQHKPPKAVVGKAVEIVRETAAEAGAQSGIGGQCSSIIVPSDRSQGAVGAYHTEVLSDRIYLPGEVTVTPQGGIAVVETSIISGAVSPERARQIYEEGPRDRTPTLEFRPIAIPKVGRNAPCPCGSEKKYKRCHGR